MTQPIPSRPAPASIECQSEIDKDLVRTYYGDLDAFYRVRAALAATPAVGGEELKDSVRGAIARGWCSRANEHKEFDVDLASSIFAEVWAEVAAAPPGSPLRGSEALASISRAVYRIREWAKNEGPYSEIIKEAAIIERRIEQIALASSPEQPAAQDDIAKMHTSGRTKAGNDISGI